jgi:hypothetical protein
LVVSVAATVPVALVVPLTEPVALVVPAVEVSRDVSRVLSDAMVELVWEEPVAPVWLLLLVAPSVSLLVLLLGVLVVDPVVPVDATCELWSRRSL